MKPKGKMRKKKPYHPPRLVAYGDFRTLTRQPKGGSTGDGAGKPNTKLSPPNS